MVRQVLDTSYEPEPRRPIRMDEGAAQRLDLLALLPIWLAEDVVDRV